MLPRFSSVVNLGPLLQACISFAAVELHQSGKRNEKMNVSNSLQAAFAADMDALPSVCLVFTVLAAVIL